VHLPRPVDIPVDIPVDVPVDEARALVKAG
jgi:hypothetical protein